MADHAVHLAGLGLSLPELASRLDVDAILVGSVFRSADRMRLDMRFVDATDEGQIWARSFDTTMTPRTCSTQGSIASNIAAALELEMSPLVAERLAARPTTNDDALNSVKLGNFSG